MRSYPSKTLDSTEQAIVSAKMQLPDTPVTVETILLTIAQHEMNLETLRQRCVREGPDFNTVDAFRLLDEEGSGEVTTKQLRTALTEVI